MKDEKLVTEEIVETVEQVEEVQEPEQQVETVEQVQDNPEEVVTEEEPEQVEEVVEEEVVDNEQSTEETIDFDEFNKRVDEIWQRQIELELKLEGLEDFIEFLDVEQKDINVLQDKIKKFKSILNQRELGDSFVPEVHAPTDRMLMAEKNKDSKGMIATKLSKLFNK